MHRIKVQPHQSVASSNNIRYLRGFQRLCCCWCRWWKQACVCVFHPHYTTWKVVFHLDWCFIPSCCWKAFCHLTKKNKLLSLSYKRCNQIRHVGIFLTVAPLRHSDALRRYHGQTHSAVCAQTTVGYIWSVNVDLVFWLISSESSAQKDKLLLTGMDQAGPASCSSVGAFVLHNLTQVFYNTMCFHVKQSAETTDGWNEDWSSSHWGNGILVVGTCPTHVWSQTKHSVVPSQQPSSETGPTNCHSPQKSQRVPGCVHSCRELKSKGVCTFLQLCTLLEKMGNSTLRGCHLERFLVKLITFVALFIIFVSKLWKKYQFREVVCKWPPQRKNAVFIP